MQTIQKGFPTPPWDMDTAAQRLKLEETAWNTHDIDQILEGYADDIDMRDGTDFIQGKEALAVFIRRTLAAHQDYSISLDLWGALKGRMAVRFEAEWRDAAGERHKNYGVQVLQFDDSGRIQKRFASYNTVAALD